MPHGGLPRPCSYLTSGSLNWPSFCLALASLDPAPFSRWPHQAHLLPQIYLPRPRSCLMVVSLTPAPASQWPRLAHLLPHSDHSRPIFCLMVASSGFALASQLPLPHPAFKSLMVNSIKEPKASLDSHLFTSQQSALAKAISSFNLESGFLTNR